MSLDQFGNYNGPGQRFGVGVQTKRGAIGFNLTSAEASRARRKALAESVGVGDVQGVENYAEPQILGMGNQRRAQEYEEQQQQNVMQQREAQARQRAIEEEQARAKKMEYLKGLSGGNPPRGMTPVEWESVVANNPDMAEKVIMGERTNALNEEQMAIRQRAKFARSKELGESVVGVMGIQDPQLKAEAMALAQQEGMTPEVLRATVGGRLKEYQRAKDMEIRARKEQESEALRLRNDEERMAADAVKMASEEYREDLREWSERLSALESQKAKALLDTQKAEIGIQIADLMKNRPTRDKVRAAYDRMHEIIRSSRKPPLVSGKNVSPEQAQAVPVRPSDFYNDVPESDNPTYRTVPFPGGGPMFVAGEPSHRGYKTAAASLTDQGVGVLRKTAEVLKKNAPDAYNRLAKIIRGPHTQEQLAVAIDEANKIALQFQEGE